MSVPYRKIPHPRFCGILLHPTSLPGPYGIGDLGPEAYDFVDFLDRAEQTLWQVLPLGPTGTFNSPYQPYSVFAGQELLISPDLLLADGLLSRDDLAQVPPFSPYQVDYEAVRAYKEELFSRAWARFFSAPDPSLAQQWQDFCREHAGWLDDYALFMALKDLFGTGDWRQWPEPFRSGPHAWEGSAGSRADELRTAFEDFRTRYRQQLDRQRFIQFLFFRQWQQLKAYANARGISIVGDLPVFTSQDGADIWARRGLFQTDAAGTSSVVAGVPPDYFSADGQLWGNPLYDWDKHRESGFAWWKDRIRSQLFLCDILRIDHFRGFESYWAVPAGSSTAKTGSWQPGPKDAFFRAMEEEFGSPLPFWAEDLGIITQEVTALRRRFGLPGMKVLQFAFESDTESSYLPYLYEENCICYTGTHDNNTSLGWFLETDEKNREHARQYMNCGDDGISWNFIRTAVSSCARCAVFPMQDLLGYGGDCRMNTPGQAKGSWQWRLTDQAFDPARADALAKLCRLYGRSRSRVFSCPEADKLPKRPAADRRTI